MVTSEDGIARAKAASESTIERTSRLFINNAYVEAEGRATLAVISPIDGKPFATIAHATEADVDLAVNSARKCFDHGNWTKLPVEERAAILRRVATALRAPDKLEELAYIESRDCGKLYSESVADIKFCADVFDYYANIGPEHMNPTPLTIPTGEGAGDDFCAKVVQEPLGVVGCVTPWNYPLFQAVIKVAPAMVTGCCVVLKPSPLASLTCCALGELIATAGAPPGAFTVVTGGPPDSLGYGSSTGQFLIDHPLLDKVSFTGSCVAGRQMLQASANQLRPTSLELGGKSAFLIFDDAEEYLDAVVDWVQVGIFSNTGQVCSATSRVLVHKDIEDKFLDRLLRATQNIIVGNPFGGSHIGPLISKAQQTKVLEYIQRAEADGCSLHRAALDIPADLRDGYYVAPTVLRNVPLNSKVWCEEIFGPVLAVTSFETEEEAVRVANDTVYGLANAVYSKDPSRCSRVAAQLKSGIVWENCSNVVFESTPFGGRLGKASGFGHEHGVAGLKEYINPKTVVRSKNPGYSFGSFPAAIDRTVE